MGCGGQGSYVSPFSEMAAVRMNEGCRTPGSPLHTDADQAALGQGLHHLSWAQPPLFGFQWPGSTLCFGGLPFCTGHRWAYWVNLEPRSVQLNFLTPLCCLTCPHSWDITLKVFPQIRQKWDPPGGTLLVAASHVIGQSGHAAISE